MVTAAEAPLMEATSVAYMFKNLSLKDWIIFSERFGMPLTHGKTSAEKDSPEWIAFRDALARLGSDWSIMTGEDGSLDFHDVGAAGERPQKPLVERMDRAIAILWRGGDLSTMSSDAVGATLQEEERQNIEISDANLISETLQQCIDRRIISMLFGPDAPILAYLKIQPKSRANLQNDLNIWGGAVDRGVKISVTDWREHFVLPTPPDDGTEALVQKTQTTALPTGSAINQSNALKLLEEASDEDMRDICQMVAANEQISPNRMPSRTVKALKIYLSTQLSSHHD